MINGGVFAIIAGLYAWQVHGWIFGVIAVVSMFVLTITANSIYMGKFINYEKMDPKKTNRNFQIIKWIIFILIMIVIAWTGTEVVIIPA